MTTESLPRDCARRILSSVFHRRAVRIDPTHGQTLDRRPGAASARCRRPRPAKPSRWPPGLATPGQPQPSVVVADTTPAHLSTSSQPRLRLRRDACPRPPLADPGRCDHLYRRVAHAVAVLCDQIRDVAQHRHTADTAHRGSSTPNTSPITPNPAADSSASHNACTPRRRRSGGAAVGTGKQQAKQPARPARFYDVHIGARPIRTFHAFPWTEGWPFTVMGNLPNSRDPRSGAQSG